MRRSLQGEAFSLVSNFFIGTIGFLTIYGLSSFQNSMVKSSEAYLLSEAS
ncbi:MAG: hypothetical protein ACUVRN_03345 [Candidatus Caldatribacteriaceae bacterium]